MKTNVRRSPSGESVLDLFHGLSDQQARELRARMLPALFELREEIVSQEQAPAARTFPRKRQPAAVVEDPLQGQEPAGEPG